MATLLESFRKFEELGESMRKFRVGRRSSLAGDDAATSYENLSSQVETSLQGAIDNVLALKALMLEAKMLPVFAHFALLRSSLEMVGTGFWLLGPVLRDERVIRSLQLAYEARRDYVSAANEIHRTEIMPTADDWVVAQLQAERLARGAIADRSLAPPSIATRLREGQKYCSNQPYSILGLWRMTSGATHGRRAILSDLLDHEVIEADSGHVRTSVSSGVVVVANVVRHIEVHMFELAFLLLDRGR